MRPTTAGSPAKRRRQSASLRMTTLDPLRLSSSEWKSLPSAGATPSTRKVAALTRWPSKRSGSFAPVIVGCHERSTAMVSNECARCEISRKAPNAPSLRPPSRPPQIVMIRAASGYGSGSNRIGLTALKIAVVAPMPSASVKTVIGGETGLGAQAAHAKRRSANKAVNRVLPAVAPHLFADAGDGAELQPRGAPRLFRREARAR